MGRQVGYPQSGDFEIFTQTVTGADTDTTMSDQIVANGHAVFIDAPSGNLADIQVANVGNANVAGKFITIAAGNTFPVAVHVSNLNKIDFRSTSGTAQIRVIIDKV